MIALKVAGCVLVITSSAAGGCLKARSLQRYVNTLQELRQIMYLFKGEMAYTKAPLPHILEHLGGQLEPPYSGWLESVREELMKNESNSFYGVWCDAVDRELETLELKEEHKVQLKETGHFLGQHDIESGIQCIEIYLQKLEWEIEKERVELEGKKRLWNCIGIMSGLFVSILLL